MRESWIDRWRGMLITQIVMFHVLGVALQTGGENFLVLSFMRNWLESYTVCAFFALAGVVWRRKNGALSFLKGKCRRLLVPYFAFGAVWAVAFIVAGRWFLSAQGWGTGGCEWWQPFVSVLLSNGYPDGLGRRVINALWFLPSMFGVVCVYWALDRFFPRRRYQILALIPLFALRRLGHPDLPWDVDRIPAFMMFVIAGRWLIPSEPMEWVSRRRALGILCAVACYAVAEASGFIRATFALAGIGGWAWFFIGMLRIYASAILAQTIEWRLFEAIGRDSLGILVTHKFPILAIQAIPGVVGWCFGRSQFVAVLSVCATSAFATACSVAVSACLLRFCPVVLGEKRVKRI